MELRILKQCFHQMELKFHLAFNYVILFLMEVAVRDICRNSTFSMNIQKKIHFKFKFFLSSNLTEKCTCVYKNLQQIIIQIMSSLNSAWPYKVIDNLNLVYRQPNPTKYIKGYIKYITSTLCDCADVKYLQLINPIGWMKMLILVEI